MDRRCHPKKFLSHAANDRLEQIPQYKIDQTDDWVAKGASRISVVSSDPEAFAGIDSDRVATFQAASGKALMNLRKATQANKVSWTVMLQQQANNGLQKSSLIYLKKNRSMLYGIRSLKLLVCMKKINISLGKA